MRFKATIGTPLQLSKLVATLERMGDTCTVHLTPDLMQFAVVPDKDAVHLSADVNQRTLFLEYAVQSKAENNRISFCVKTENFARALRSCCTNQAEHVQLKLTKKQGVPALSFEIILGEQTAVQVLHEVPIRIMVDPRETVTEPPIGGDSDSAVAVIFPARDFKSLKNVVERMRSVHSWMRITVRTGASGPSSGVVNEADGAGELELRVSKPELVLIKTTYPRLGVPIAAPADDDAAAQQDDEPSGGVGGGVSPHARSPASHAATPFREEASASVEAKKLLRVLQSLAASDLRIQNAIICVVPNSMVIIKIYLHDQSAQSFLIYYLPVVVQDDDE